ncbi:MAG: PEP-CTERM sorting domain-containing protein [Thiomicrorhabdus sp.]|nr:PEP-CTERM sorting domain-containing protein [Thiomicrorhabdus sp.]
MVDKIKKVLMVGLLSVASSAYSMETLIDFDDQSVGSFSQLTIQDATFSMLGGTSSIGTLNASLGEPFANKILILEGTSDSEISFEEPIRSLSFNFFSTTNAGSWTLSSYGSYFQPIDSISFSGVENLVTLNSLESNVSYIRLTQNFDGLTPNTTVISYIDNVTYSEVSPIPEPSTYALMLGGLGLVGFMAYRRKKV